MWLMLIGELNMSVKSTIFDQSKYLVVPEVILSTDFFIFLRLILWSKLQITFYPTDLQTVTHVTYCVSTNFTSDFLIHIGLSSHLKWQRGKKLLDFFFFHLQLELLSFGTHACDSVFTGNQRGAQHFQPISLLRFLQHYFLGHWVFLICADPWCLLLNDVRGFTEMLEDFVLQ